MNIKHIMIVSIENEPSTLKIQPKTDKNITAPPIKMEHNIITSFGTYQTVNTKYNGSCKTISIKNINPNITASTMVLCIDRVISIKLYILKSVSLGIVLPEDLAQFYSIK